MRSRPAAFNAATCAAVSCFIKQITNSLSTPPFTIRRPIPCSLSSVGPYALDLLHFRDPDEEAFRERLEIGTVLNDGGGVFGSEKAYQHGERREQSYPRWVRVREKEIAIRLAMGAQRSQISQWVGRQAAMVVGPGIILGLLGRGWASQWLQSMVFKVSAQDPATLFAAAGVLIVIATVAASVPIWRATRVDPVRNLHDA